MAKRKRLTPANPAFLEPAPEAKSGFPMRAPIADVAREASSTAAVEEMAQTLREAREGGRMVISVPLGDIALDYLVRDRVAVPDSEQAALVDSIARRGQQTPVELVDLGPDAAPRYGLISGWRRVMALRSLASGGAGRADAPAGAFAQVLGLLRQPGDASQAYLAMIEENEIRLGLSYYERARIALKSVQQGAFSDVPQALAVLFENASKAKRSKIKSFVTVACTLDGVLRFPTALGERLGLQLAQALEADDTLTYRLLKRIEAGNPVDFEAEQALIRAELAQSKSPAKPADKSPDKATKANLGGTAGPAHASGTASQPAPGGQPKAPVHLRSRGPHQLVLEGRGVDAAFRADLAAWLAARQG